LIYNVRRVYFARHAVIPLLLLISQLQKVHAWQLPNIPIIKRLISHLLGVRQMVGQHHRGESLWQVYFLFIIRILIKYWILRIPYVVLHLCVGSVNALVLLLVEVRGVSGDVEVVWVLLRRANTVLVECLLRKLALNMF
jgi:hypothetical protein